MHSVSQIRRQRLTRAEQQAVTRQRVLDAADEVFAEHGFHAARLEEIAERAGYTRGAVYSNFKDKNELALAIIEQRIDLATALLKESAAGAVGDSVAAARLAGPRFAQLFEGERSWAPLFLEFLTHASRHPEIGPRLADLYRGLTESIADVLKTFSPPGPGGVSGSADRLASSMLAATEGVAIQRLIDPERVDPQLLGEMLGWITAGRIASNKPSGDR
jgi:AcrR family transcriptional regulator